MKRSGPRVALLPTSLALSLALAACAQAPLPPARLYQLPLEAAAESTTPLALGEARHWALRQPVRLPSPLDRTQLLLEDGPAALEVLDAHRWAEPLRDGIARVLRHDLAARLPRGSRVALLPGETAAAVQTRISVEIDELRLQATPPGVSLAARWTLRASADAADRPGSTCASEAEARITWPAANAQAESLVLALREALAELARRIVRQAPAGC